MKYFLYKIDLLDTYPLADVFDEEKYSLVGEVQDLSELVKNAVDKFYSSNLNITTYENWLEHAEDGGYEFTINSENKEIFRASIVLIDSKVKKALKLAIAYHGDQIRKGDNHPYLEHPLEVVHILWRNGFPADILASGFCHDLLEDTDCPNSKIEDKCGSEVLRIVKAVSNDKSLSAPSDWERKKRKYIETVREGGEKALAVSIADKIANLYSLFDQYEKEGSTLWKKFNRGKEKKIWFEEEVLKMAKSQKWYHPLLKVYEIQIEKLKKQN